MMAGLPEPKVVGTLANRGKQIDALVDDVVNNPLPKPLADIAKTVANPRKAIEDADEKAITSDIAEKKAKKYKADREAFDAAAKGMPKPSLLDRAKKAVGL
jgi:hypothetical protein